MAAVKPNQSYYLTTFVLFTQQISEICNRLLWKAYQDKREDGCKPHVKVKSWLPFELKLHVLVDLISLL